MTIVEGEHDAGGGGRVPPADEADLPGSAPVGLDGDYLCPHCGYILRGLTRDRCPECGRPFDRSRLSESALPWMHCGWRLRLRAFWSTVWLVSLRPKMLAAEFGRPASFSDAQRFRWLVILWAWLPLGFSAGLWHLGYDEDFLMLGSARLITDGWLAAGFNGAAVFALVALTGVPSYFFHPRRLPVEQQNRGVALSYYAAGPFALAPVVYVAAGIVAIVSGSRVAGVYAAFGLTLVIVGMWWRALAALAGRVLREQAGATRMAYLLPPAVAVVAGGLAFGGVNLVVWFFGLMYYSLSD